jgi:Fe-Mn family superoxide dismutase
LLQKIESARKENSDFDAKAVSKALSFNVAGHILHSLFWENLAPAGKGGGGKPTGTLAKVIDEEFGSFERFKKEFSQVALTAEGSAWAVLALDASTQRLLLMQIEKHNVNIVPGLQILLVLDAWEHAYYIDYKNEKARFAEAFWNIVDWQAANKRFNQSSK